jgi:hypothetical protein
MTDPDLERIWAERERWRRRGYGEFVQSLADRDGLRLDLDLAAATDVALTILGPATYLALVEAHGWSHTRYLAWIPDAAAALLLRQDAPSAIPGV